jgi:putative phage-type endonuclease
MEQGSDAWKLIRLGKLTASRISDVIAKTKSGYSASRENYAAQLVAERLTGCVQESFTNDAMRWGTENEPLARSAYECLRGEMVEQVGFVDHTSIPMSGASPDGLIGEEGLIEIKCPNTATHISYLLGQEVPEKYKPQMAWQMICTGRKWCDFVSFDPRLPGDLQLFVVRYIPDTEYLEMIESEVVKFLDYVSSTVSSLNALRKAE